MAKSGHKGISRIDQPERKTHGWYVRVRFNGEQRSKFFSDEGNGGREESLSKAIHYRNVTERELGKPRTDRLVIASNPRNRSGIMGIQRKTKTVKTPTGERKVQNVYEVSWNPEPGRLRRTWVSIDEYGEEAALRKACAIRREKERQMFGSEVLSNWTNNLARLLAVSESL